MASTDADGMNDEIKTYQDYIYYSSTEATWRLFVFCLSDISPGVILPIIHLENEERIYFNANTVSSCLVHTRTHLTAWFDSNRRTGSDLQRRTILFPYLPKFYTWDDKNKACKKTKNKMRFTTLGRIHTIHPLCEDTCYLRIILHHVPGATGYKYLRTYDGVVYLTMKEACVVRCLLEVDNEWFQAMDSARNTAMPLSIRHLC